MVMNHIYRQLVVRRLVEGEASEVVYHDIAERFDDFVWVGCGEADDCGSGGAAGVDTVEGILEYICLGRLAAEDFHTFEEALGIWLGLGEVLAGKDGVGKFP